MVTSESKFARDSAVSATAQPGVWQATIPAEWCVFGVPHGGFLLAIAARAISEALPHKDPLTISAYYLAKTELGSIHCEVDVLRTGGSISHAVARLVQNNEIKVQLTAAYTDLDRLQGETSVRQDAPALPAFADCSRLPEPAEITFAQQLTRRVLPGQEQNFLGHPDQSSRWSGWIGLGDKGPVDLFALLLFSDAFPPPVFTLYGPTGWTPTLELNVQLREKPTDPRGLVKAEFNSHFLTRGIVEEDGTLWSADNCLLAVCRQTAKFRLPGVSSET